MREMSNKVIKVTEEINFGRGISANKSPISRSAYTQLHEIQHFGTIFFLLQK